MIGAMQDLLRTKLFIPPLPFEAIPRPHLVERLNRGAAGKLSLVTAPAGYGKTTLVTTWLHQLTESDTDSQAVWLSLDEGDNDIRCFFSHFVAALGQLDESFANRTEAFLQESSGEFTAIPLIRSLVNQIVDYGQPVTFVLDDYHEIQEPEIHEAISFLLDSQPPTFHLVISSRAEPPLPLPRMRVRRQVTEISTDDLRFSRSESDDFLNQHMGLNLLADDIAQLDSITEGWVAGLQLAALSLRNKDDPARFIQNFKGDNRYIVDFLANEVLRRQPGPIRDFLLQTSILERFNFELCNAVTGQVDSQDTLEALDQARLFLIPLDDHRHWYRYHHLFAECLQAELLRAKPEEAPECHERASRWLSSKGFLSEAIQHAFAAEKSSLAAELIAANARFIFSEQGETSRLWQWIQQLPDKTINASPQLLIVKAWLTLYLFEDTGCNVPELLNSAANLIHASDAPYSTVETANMLADIALAQAELESLRGNIEQAVQHCERAVELIKNGNSSTLRVGARGALAITHFQAGNIAQSLMQGAAQIELIGREKPLNYARYAFLSVMLDALRLHGQLTQAELLFQRIEPFLPQSQGASAMMFVISWAELLRERNQLDLAVDILIPAIEGLRALPSMALVVQKGTVTLARIFQAQGKGLEALKLLKDSVRNSRAGDAISPLAPIPATEALLQLRQGNLRAAKAWAEENGLQATDDPTYVMEIDYLVLARVLIEDGDAQAAQPLLSKLEQAAAGGGRIARLIEVHTLQALAHQASGETDQALCRLGQAVDFAQTAGFARVFVDEGKALVPLLQQIAGRGQAVAYLRRLLPLFDGIALPRNASIVEETTDEVESDVPSLLLNPLTQRELATLRYLASDRTIPEIAEQMIVAPSTIRTYVKSIYGKLDVHNRIAAVNRARSLELIV